MHVHKNDELDYRTSISDQTPLAVVYYWPYQGISLLISPL